MKLSELNERKKPRFESYHLTILTKDGRVLRSDDFDRASLKMKFEVGDKDVFSFAKAYEDYIQNSVIPRRLSGTDDVLMVVGGENIFVPVDTIVDMWVIFNFE